MSEVDLMTYLERAEESERSFSRRSGVGQRTINRICRGESGCNLLTALMIREASRKQPGPSGETVGIEQLAASFGPGPLGRYRAKPGAA